MLNRAVKEDFPSDDSDAEGDEEEEGDESEDEDGKMLTNDVDLAIHRTIQAIKKKDAAIYDPSKIFFAGANVRAVLMKKNADESSHLFI